MNIGIYIGISAGAVVIVGLMLFFVIRKVRQDKKRKQSEIAVNQKVEESADKLSGCFGGKDNILSISQKGSRVSVSVKDIQLVDHDEINKELSSVMFMNNKVVFVIGSKSEEFSKLLQANIDKVEK